ncbi:hypothetical protein CLV58_109106 [Spirosoma oryzae]|uniref:Uncharacterized protein n=1 Tax=Spirosoma oryzae TaxID=1469603 RepID=A0A2T0SYA1_9BACT|nr:hypothetical protein [Spirosoma oryzae]PRY38379.1 hypothetical protein CLV58_109106 [Spirosoma oryzae]
MYNDLTDLQVGEFVRLVDTTDEELEKTNYQIGRIYRVKKIPEIGATGPTFFWFNHYIELDGLVWLDGVTSYHTHPRIYSRCFERIHPFQARVAQALHQLNQPTYE